MLAGGPVLAGRLMLTESLVLAGGPLGGTPA
jgi:hypothetical protein